MDAGGAVMPRTIATRPVRTNSLLTNGRSMLTNEIYLVLGAGDLDGHGFERNIPRLGAKDIHQLLDLGAIGGSGVHFDQRRSRITAGVVRNIAHFGALMSL